jgi:hypothetical protein
MKRSLLFLMLCLSMTFLAKAQAKLTVEIPVGTVDICGKTTGVTQQFSETLTEGGILTVILYDDSKYQYGVEFKYNRSTNRLKLDHREFAEKKANAKRIYKKWTSQVQYIKVAIAGKFTGSCGGSITVDKKSLEFLKVSADFTVSYL